MRRSFVLTPLLTAVAAVLAAVALVGAITAPGADAATKPRAAKLRVLVTGFNDWENLGSPANVWKCDSNPTCRLLIGSASSSKPSTYNGPLVQKLKAMNSSIAWTFQTLPVTFGVFDSSVASGQYDVVVDLGLGVYDTNTAIQYEEGAANWDAGTDAAGNAPNAKINPNGSDLTEPQGQLNKINAAVAAGALPGGFTVRTHVNPDNGNLYVCNDTHYRALAAVAAGRTGAAYFMHLPYAADPNNYQPLATAAATAILRLVG